MPRLIDMEDTKELFDGFNDPDENHDKYLLYKGKSGFDLSAKIGVQTPEGIELKVVDSIVGGHKLVIVALDHRNERVKYYNAVDEVDIDLPNQSDRPVAQLMIWRHPNSDDLSGIVTKVFFDFLVEDYSIVVSDSEQTRDGMRMWQKFIGAALKITDLSVFSYDRKSKQLSPIKSEKDLYNVSGWLWGDSSIHEERLAVISK